jgi:hypothetical protein
VFDPNSVPEPEQPILEGLLYRGDLVVWIGREKHRKSNLTLQTAICAALGRPFLHFRHGTGEPMHVVILDYESKPASFYKRYEGICSAMRLSREERNTLRAHMQTILVRKLRRGNRQVPRFPVHSESKEEKVAEAWWKQLAHEYPADLYIFDPMRCLHMQDENTSTIEALLSKLRDVFPNATVIVPHHMNRISAGAQNPGGHTITLRQPDDLRAFANGGRGSTAINAHTDVVVCQERVVEGDIETVYFGAYMKDAADVEPLPLVESDHESFYWIVSRNVPEKLRTSYETLRRAAHPFKGEADAVAVLIARQNGHGLSRSTAYRHLKQLRDGGFLALDSNGKLVVGECSSEI